MKKSNAYITGMQDALLPFSEQQNKTADSVHDFQNHLNEIIDCIIWNHDDPEKLIEILKRKRASKPKQFRIAIVYSGKENDALAEALRKDLNNQKNTCHKLDYHSFVKKGSNIVDYRVYIGNPEQVKEEKCKVLYKAYGMSILQDNSSYIVNYDPKFHFDSSNKECFIKYYESIISKSLERSKKAEKALQQRKDRMGKSGGSIDPVTTNTVLDAVMQGTENAVDYWWDKPDWMKIAFGIPTVLVSTVGTILTFVLCVPVMVSEILLRNTIENLQEADFDSKFVADAQRQILEVKIVDLFKIEQSKDNSVDQNSEELETNSNTQSSIANNETDNVGDTTNSPVDEHEINNANKNRTLQSQQTSKVSPVKKGRVGKYYGIRPKDAVKFWWADTKYTLGIKSKKKP